ncbi:uncharacterized protein M421DRAFT_171720 [Didymella exigua CBS 183.55]|uniref:BTB domain-containing protein n=1 Tax=Didymella exigua CBS 183.55 TaxID=1150837 RepID=A0A6A5RJL0_9PLEO|nr:uncharacterized protein M421DRAFT_171720 [Didymella exigua CBS 183.55]KAF1927623.1 hypothetical protein M421DRAFT_171720 [Didymella exigua CBS 183.55]
MAAPVKHSAAEYRAHKAVICIESRFFHKAFTGNFKEASDNIIELHHDPADHFESLLKYICTNNYDRELIEKLARNNATAMITEAIGIYIVTDKYQFDTVPDLTLQHVKAVPLGSKDQQKNATLLSAALQRHYSARSGTGTVMGNRFVAIILESQQDFTNSKAFD